MTADGSADPGDDRDDGSVTLLVVSLTVLIVVIVAAILVVVRGFVRLRQAPRNGPVTGASGRNVVVCLGASTVRGNVSFNFVDEVARRLPDHKMVNAGVNGDTSAQVLARLAPVVACAPAVVVVQVGANDLLAMRGGPMARDNAEAPTWDGFAANLAAIIDGLRPTGARLALMSIQPVGEDLGDALNRDLQRLNAIIRETASAQGVAYLPLNERLAEVIRAHGTGRAATESVGPMVRAIVLHLGLGVGLDRIGRSNGYAVHSDGLHLAGRGGLVAADLVEEFVRQPGDRAS